MMIQILSKRDFISLCIFIYILIQIYLPLNYYLLEKDKMNEWYSWRMFSEKQMAGKELEIFFSPYWMNNTNNGILIKISDHFNEIWTKNLIRGPNWILEKACIFICSRIQSAKSVKYIWYIYEWEGINYNNSNTIYCNRNFQNKN